MLQCVDIFESPTRFVLVAMQQTVDGLWTMSPAVQTLEKPQKIGLAQAAAQALSQSRTGVARITDWKELVRPFLNACGERSWAGVQRKFRMVKLERADDVVRTTPTRNGGTSGDDKGFHELEALRITSNDGDNQALEAAILEAFKRCID